MPLSNYDDLFGGESGAAQKAYDSMVEQHGEEKGKQVFYGRVENLKKAAKDDMPETDIEKAAGAATDRHGPLHDRFDADSGSPHGGAAYDEFGQPTGPTTKHDALFDRFEERPGVDRYGERFDEFGWRDMPARHGQLFDNDFAQPAATEGNEHGTTWYDIFRDGTQVRYIYGGRDFEGVVENRGNDHLITRSHEGDRHEVGLGQILQWRDAPAANSGPARRERNDGERRGARSGNEDSAGNDADRPPQGQRPSGESESAHGGGERGSIESGMERVAEPARGRRGGSAGGSVDAGMESTATRVTGAPARASGSSSGPSAPRNAAPDSGMDSVFANKALDDAIDVEKAASSAPAMRGMLEQHRKNLHLLSSTAVSNLKKIRCPGCGSGRNYHLGHIPFRTAEGGVSSKMFGHCSKEGGGCGFSHHFAPPSINANRSGTINKSLLELLGLEKPSGEPVEKDVDATETAVQARDTEPHAYCPNCRHTCRKLDNGKCPTCGGPVQTRKEGKEAEEEDADKAAPSDADVLKSLAELAGV